MTCLWLYLEMYSSYLGWSDTCCLQHIPYIVPLVKNPKSCVQLKSKIGKCFFFQPEVHCYFHINMFCAMLTYFWFQAMGHIEMYARPCTVSLKIGNYIIQNGVRFFPRVHCHIPHQISVTLYVLHMHAFVFIVWVTMRYWYVKDTMTYTVYLNGIEQILWSKTEEGFFSQSMWLAPRATCLSVLYVCIFVHSYQYILDIQKQRKI